MQHSRLFAPLLLVTVATVLLISAPPSEAGSSTKINIDINIALMINAMQQPDDAPSQLMSLMSMLPPDMQKKLGPFLKMLLKMQIKQLKQMIKNINNVLKNLKNLPNMESVMAALMGADPNISPLAMMLKEEMSMKMAMALAMMPDGPMKNMMMKALMSMMMPPGSMSNPMMNLAMSIQAMIQQKMPPMPPSVFDQMMEMLMKAVPALQPYLKAASDSPAISTFNLSLKIQAAFHMSG